MRLAAGPHTPGVWWPACMVGRLSRLFLDHHGHHGRLLWQFYYKEHCKKLQNGSGQVVVVKEPISRGSQAKLEDAMAAVMVHTLTANLPGSHSCA